MPSDEQTVYDFCTEFFKTKQVSDATFQAIKDKIDERGFVEVIALAGEYEMVSLFMNVDRYPLEPSNCAPASLLRTISISSASKPF
jgi:4-carboxymuconolactone decarboxylase